MGSFPYTVSDKTLTAYVEGKPYMTDRSNPNWETIKNLLNDPATEADKLINAIKPIGAIASALQGVVSVEVLGGQVLVDGQPIHGVLAQRVLDIAAEGLSIEPWVKFVQNIWANPFTEAREELYTWLERGRMPITPDGCFLAYKVVQRDFMDRHTGTIRYGLGDTPSMPRDNCDNKSRALCSNGLHFCSAEYLPQFGVHAGDHVMMVKINPADVVSIPPYETHKGRTWRMEVVGEIDAKLAGIKDWTPIDDTWDVPEETVSEHEAGDYRDPATGDVPMVNTLDFGGVTAERLTRIKAEAGNTWAGVARHFSRPPGTIAGWVKSLRKQGADI